MALKAGSSEQAKKKTLTTVAIKSCSAVEMLLVLIAAEDYSSWSIINPMSVVIDLLAAFYFIVGLGLTLSLIAVHISHSSVSK